MEVLATIKLKFATAHFTLSIIAHVIPPILTTSTIAIVPQPVFKVVDVNNTWFLLILQINKPGCVTDYSGSS